MENNKLLVEGETFCYGLVKEQKESPSSERTVLFGNKIYSILLTCPTGDLSEFINDEHPGWEIAKLAHFTKLNTFRILEICTPQ